MHGSGSSCYIIACLPDWLHCCGYGGYIRYQALAGALSAGGGKAVEYLIAKVSKAWSSKAVQSVVHRAKHHKHH